MHSGKSLSTKIILMVEVILLLSSAIFCGVSISWAQGGIRRAIRQRMVDISNCAAGLVNGDVLENLHVPIRLCATAVTLESVREYMDLLSECRHVAAVQIAVSRIESAGSYHMLRAQNPVFIFSAEMGGNP